MNHNIIRNINAIFSLNDDYEGGELCFIDLNLFIKLKKKSVIIFPAYWTHRYKINSLLKNTVKYTLDTCYGTKIDYINI